MIVLFLDTNKLSPTPEETFIWVITKTQHKWVRSELGTKALAQEVAALRCGLDAAAWDGEGAMKCAELLKIGIVDAPQIGQPLPFDTLRTHKLYDALFGQIEDVIEGKDLLVVPSGPLNKLPFQVLVTDATEPSQSGTNDFRNTAWLAKQHGITVLPSVASLKALRQFARTSRATEPFIGFGNPLLVGPDGKDNRAWDRQSCEAVMAGKPINIAMRSAPGNISKYFRNGLADLSVLLEVAPLSETADELCDVAKLNDAPDTSVYLGEKATERQIKSLSADGTLAKARIVHFATHGLLAGESEEILKAKADRLEAFRAGRGRVGC